ncbi:IclR family transcriptional regulator [Halostagnicola sp. A-GB9-2]|uniref:IclR family transcriptional regulator n=1 Tax=Halostagnicola sp. A-GB9-2 TaxID=3048066 RepID=UPI0024BF8986|nr:IclR family transcriptional regulator [Halostagnicola sp. A-GB9-2]MDJ1433750.1 IclR family transcriptional regulator [Halostagnicola sp. A-GB9-2]
MEEQSKKIHAVERSLEIIEIVADAEPAGVSEIAREMPVSKSTVYTHLNTLVENGYVTKDGDTYRLSCKFLTLGSSVQERFELYQMAKQHIDELASKTGEPTNLVVEMDGKGICLYATNPRNSADVFMSSGERNHMHATGTGKAILAHMPDSEVEAIVDQHGLPELTEHTITSRAELFEELEHIAERGLAFDRQETIHGLYCISAPVIVDDDVIGAISVSGPVNRFTNEERRAELSEAVEEIANVIELRFVFS